MNKHSTMNKKECQNNKAIRIEHWL